MFGHLPEVFGLLVLGLIIFGPKRMIELGGQLGRMLRELQSAMKDMNWNPLSDESSTESSGSSSSSQTTLGKLSQMAQDFTSRRTVDAAETPAPTPAPTPTPAPATVVEATPQPTSDATVE